MPTATWERLPEARRRAVVAAAEAEFARHGFSGGSLNAIARDAGVAKGSLFQYFTDKADLYAYLSELASVRIRDHMAAEMAALPWRSDFFGALRRLLRVWVAYFRSHPVERAVTAAVNLEPDPAARSAVRSVVNRHYLEVLQPLVAEAVEAGQLRRDADTGAFAAMMLLVLPHLALAPTMPALDPVLGLGSEDEAAAGTAVDRLVDVLERAFGPAAP